MSLSIDTMGHFFSPKHFGCATVEQGTTLHSVRTPSFVSALILSILAVVALLSVNATAAGDGKPVPVRLAPGLNKGNVDNINGAKYFSFWAGPGPVTINLAYKSLGIFGNPLRQVMHFNLYTADGQLLNQWSVQSYDKLEHFSSSGQVPKRIQYVMEVKAQDGTIRLGGYYEILVTGTVDFGDAKNNTSDAKPIDTSLVNPGVQLVNSSAPGPSTPVTEKPVRGYPLMFRPQTVEVAKEMPPELASKYPNHGLLIITFKPATHPADKTGSNLQPGEGSWVDRGMRPGEPGILWVLIPDDSMLPHTLRVSEGPFLYSVINTKQGHLETVPPADPELKTVPE